MGRLVSAQRSGVVVCLTGLALAACQGAPETPGFGWDGFAETRPELIDPGRTFAAEFARGREVALGVVSGALPTGVRLGDDGILRGSPVEAAILSRFCVEARSPDGVPLGTRCTAIGTGAYRSTLAAPMTPVATGDRLDLTWQAGRDIERGFAFDPRLRLFWPLSSGSPATGAALASPDGVLEMVARTAGGEGRNVVPTPRLDDRAQVVVQLLVEGDAAIELQLLPEPDLAAPAVTAAQPVLEKDGTWLARQAIASPLAQAVLLSDAAPTGRWAMVAVKKGGSATRIPLWLSVRMRDGTSLAETRFDVRLSDVAQGEAMDELAAGRQSVKALGVIDTRDGAVKVLAPARTGGPFDVAEGE